MAVGASTPTSAGRSGFIQEPVLYYAALVLILSAAAYFRFRGLGEDSLWPDEAASWSQATAGGVIDVISATAQDNYPPLHNLILWAVTGLLGDNEWALRLPSAIFGVANVLAIYWVGTLVAGRTTGLIAATLLGFSAFHIWYSQEARMYALLALSATLLVGCSLRLLARPTAINAICVVLAALALLYSHPYGMFTWLSIVVPIAGILIWRPQAAKIGQWSWLTLQLIAAVGFLPWVPVLLNRSEVINKDGFWIPFPTPGFVYHQIGAVLGNPFAPAIVAVTAVLAFAIKGNRAVPLSIEAGTKPRTLTRVESLLIILFWALGPMLLGYLVSVVSQPVFLARYLIGALPALLILAAVGLSRFAYNWASAALILALAAGVSWFYEIRHPPRDDWRSAGALVSELYGAAPGCLVVTGKIAHLALSYYFRQPVNCVIHHPSPAPVDPGRIPADFVLLVATGYDGKSVDEIADNMQHAFPEPIWHQLGSSSFRGVTVAAVSRNSP